MQNIVHFASTRTGKYRKEAGKIRDNNENKVEQISFGY